MEDEETIEKYRLSQYDRTQVHSVCSEIEGGENVEK
jgi:hypothetical protein